MLALPDFASLSREEFQAIHDAGPDAAFALFQGLLSEIMALETRVKELEDRLSKDSHNSGKPPSSDGLARQPKSLREKSGKPSSGQTGHPEKTLECCDAPQERIVHSPPSCDGCGAETVAREWRQVFDLPPLKFCVTEHQIESRRCACCGTVSRGRFPDGVTQPVQYGVDMKSLLTWLQAYQLLPYARTCERFGDLFGAAISEGTLSEVIQTGSARLETTEAAIREALTNAKVAHFDETGLRIEGTLQWLHSASAETLTCYSRQKKRGQEGMAQAGILPDFGGRAVHDSWASYFLYDCPHALCNAHPLRELTFLAERRSQARAQAMITLLREMKQAVGAAREAGKAALEAETLRPFEERYEALLHQGERANPPPVPAKKP